jgi:hypothetical protein
MTKDLEQEIENKIMDSLVGFLDRKQEFDICSDIYDSIINILDQYNIIKFNVNCAFDNKCFCNVGIYFEIDNYEYFNRFTF